MNKEILERIKYSVRSNDPEAEAYLFGSRSRGDQRPDSDWDVLILVNNQNISDALEDKFRDTLYNLEVETGQIISVLIYPKNYWNKNLVYSPLYKSVQKEGIRLC